MAAAHWPQAHVMTWQQEMAEKPWLHSFLWAMMRHEALADDKPKIGDSATRREEFLDVGQVPHLDFPASNVATYTPATETTKARLRVKFLGMLGPMGPLPSSTTEEALAWYAKRDEAFTRFLDIFNNRFLQLFYRAYADARPAAHAMRPGDDRFRDFVGATIGLGGRTWRDLDEMPDYQKLCFAGLLGPRRISASQLESLAAGVFGIQAEVDQFVGAPVPIDMSEQTRLGSAFAVLGKEAMLGSEVTSVDTKFRLRLFPGTLKNYERFLPGGDWNQRLIDAIMNAVGFEYEWDVELVLPDREPQPTRLGSYGQLGWTSWVRKPGVSDDATFVRTRFTPINDDVIRSLN
ncbi:MAG: type VI secretion system baseplate subunit TssG [Paracoccaceae bacterium]